MLLKQIFTTPKPHMFSIDSSVCFLSHSVSVLRVSLDKTIHGLTADFLEKARVFWFAKHALLLMMMLFITVFKEVSKLQTKL